MTASGKWLQPVQNSLEHFYSLAIRERCTEVTVYLYFSEKIGLRGAILAFFHDF